MFRRQPRAIFRGVFKPNFLLSWPSVRYVVQLLFRGSFSLAPYPTVVIHCWCPACVLSCIYPASMVAVLCCAFG
jgi:hypothetical protein